jgi:hypothetical protein
MNKKAQSPSNLKYANKKSFIESKNKFRSFYNSKDITTDIENITKVRKLNLLNRTNPLLDKENIKSQIYNIKQEIEIMNIELSQLKKLEIKMQNKFMANKIIMEKILNIEEEEENKNEENNEIKDYKEDNEGNNNIKDNIEKNDNKEINDKENNNKNHIYITEINN